MALHAGPMTLKHINGGGWRGRNGVTQMNTATLRLAARDAASVANWVEAADLMAEAIARYPISTRSALARLDIETMQRALNGYRAAALADA